MLKKMPIDRTKVCPFLMRVFWKENDFHQLEEFADKGKDTAENEVQIHTWRNATLRELVDLIKSAVGAAQKKDARFEFSFVFQDMNGTWRRKKVGTVHSVKKTRDEFQDLQDLKFVIGDYVDLNIQTN